ncbi:MAG: OmpA family protein [Nannocystaceae bacterium]|nr:OmpA family protein [Nannocystaceae bacterium]
MSALGPTAPRVWGEDALALALLCLLGGAGGMAWSIDTVAAATPDATATAGTATVTAASAPAATPSAAVPGAGAAAVSPATAGGAAMAAPAPASTPATPSDCPPLFGVAFQRGATTPEAIDDDAVAALVRWLESHPRSVLVVQGHADASGRASYNFTLSHRRARAVAKRFRAAGVAASRVVAQAVGEFQPRVGAGPEENRRVVLRATEADGCPGAFTVEDNR